jgi:hypothetical protein
VLKTIQMLLQAKKPASIYRYDFIDTVTKCEATIKNGDRGLRNGQVFAI